VLVADNLISKTQEGFVKSRQMVWHALRLEAVGKTLTFLQRVACFLFLDMAAAFPSLSRKCIFVILWEVACPGMVG